MKDNEIKIDCSKCTNHCCGKSNVAAPILMPYEVEKFKNDCHLTNEGVYRMNKNPKTGFCKFLSNDVQCTIYENRPLECKLFPLVLSWNGESISLRKCYEGNCPQRDNVNIMSPPEEVKTISSDWWDNYEKVATENY